MPGLERVRDGGIDDGRQVGNRVNGQNANPLGVDHVGQTGVTHLHRTARSRRRLGVGAGADPHSGTAHWILTDAVLGTAQQLARHLRMVLAQDDDLVDRPDLRDGIRHGILVDVVDSDDLHTGDLRQLTIGEGDETGLREEGDLLTAQDFGVVLKDSLEIRGHDDELGLNLRNVEDLAAEVDQRADWQGVGLISPASATSSNNVIEVAGGDVGRYVDRLLGAGIGVVDTTEKELGTKDAEQVVVTLRHPADAASDELLTFLLVQGPDLAQVVDYVLRNEVRLTNVSREDLHTLDLSVVGQDVGEPRLHEGSDANTVTNALDRDRGVHRGLSGEELGKGISRELFEDLGHLGEYGRTQRCQIADLDERRHIGWHIVCSPWLLAALAEEIG